MKLSNQQIDALVAMIAKKQNAKHKVENDKKIEAARKKNIVQAKQLMKFYETIPKELRGAMYRNNPLNERGMVDWLSKDIDTKCASKDEIRNEILIASIDAQTLDQLKLKLKNYL